MFKYKDHIHLSAEGIVNSYIRVVPIIFRDKDKYFYVTDGTHHNWHRINGPALMIGKSKVLEWWINGDDWTEEVLRWCTSKDIDPADLSEMDAIAMCLEVL